MISSKILSVVRGSLPLFAAMADDEKHSASKRFFFHNTPKKENDNDSMSCPTRPKIVAVNASSSDEWGEASSRRSPSYTHSAPFAKPRSSTASTMTSVSGELSPRGSGGERSSPSFSSNGSEGKLGQPVSSQSSEVCTPLFKEKTMR